MIELLLAGAAAYGAYRAGRKIWQHSQAAAQSRQQQRYAAAQQQLQWEKEQQERRRTAAMIQQAARLMQVSLIQLGQSPDFRRAATFAKHAKSVPATFRVRQFRRFRPLLVEHLATRLRQGMSAEELLPGLTELVTALGVADYEADYIRRDAETRGRPAAQPQPGYASQIQQLQAEHQQRVEALRNVPDLPAELREQLLESEHQRFRDRLLATNENQPSNQNDA